MIKSIMKVVLDKVGVLEKAKRGKVRIIGNVLARDELNVNAKILKDGDAIEHTLRVKIHGLEKMFVVGNSAVLNNVKPVSDVLLCVDKLLGMGYTKESNIVVEGLSIINCFITVCREKSIGCSEIELRVDGLIAKHNLNIHIGDYTSIEIVKRISKPTGTLLGNYKEFAETRVSVRKSRPDIIDPKITREIIGLANMCPSSGNRQPCKVYYSSSVDIQTDLKALCGDKQVSSNLYNFMVPTVDKSLFAPTEFFQAWLNGGIFVGSLINAIHAHGLGACMFQTIKNSENGNKIKNLLNIPSHEDIICIVGFGEYPENVNHIKKHRKPVGDIAVERYSNNNRIFMFKQARYNGDGLL